MQDHLRVTVPGGATGIGELSIFSAHLITTVTWQSSRTTKIISLKIQQGIIYVCKALTELFTYIIINLASEILS